MKPIIPFKVVCSLSRLLVPQRQARKKRKTTMTVGINRLPNLNPYYTPVLIHPNVPIAIPKMTNVNTPAPALSPVVIGVECPVNESE